MLASVEQLDTHPAGDQVASSIPSGSGNILSWRLIMKYFLSYIGMWKMLKCYFFKMMKGFCGKLMIYDHSNKTSVTINSSSLLDREFV